MDVKERRPYCSLTKSRREKERRYTGSSGDSEDCRVPTQKSYSSSETLKAFDHDSSRLLYGGHVKEMVHREADEYSRQGQNFNLRQLGICEPATRRGLAFCAEMGLPHRGYSVGAGSDVDTENEGVMSPERAMRLWGRGVKSGRNSCLSSRSNSALTLTDTEHENKSDSENAQECSPLRVAYDPSCPTHLHPPDWTDYKQTLLEALSQPWTLIKDPFVSFLSSGGVYDSGHSIRADQIQFWTQNKPLMSQDQKPALLPLAWHSGSHRGVDFPPCSQIALSIQTSSFQTENFSKKQSRALSVFAEEADDVSTGGDV
ncbi:teneurin-3 [Danio aesculapii]|uniref:teneurin-3 n=1 Tax=Danio aesculapii TaxID=1142201 RepID=UPI0024C0BFF0|nr:teneurin-3 [Danio aesculapii]